MKELTQSQKRESNRITTKELFERVIAIETKVDLNIESINKLDLYAKATRNKFRNYIFLLVGLTIIDVLSNVLMIYLQVKV